MTMAGESPSTGGAKQAAEEVASTAKQETRAVASQAVEQVSEVKDVVASQAADFVSEARGQARQQAQSQTEQLASTLRSWVEQLDALIEGRPDDAGKMRELAGDARSRLDSMVSRLESGGFDGAASDVKRFARRRPGVFLLGAAAAGFGVGRLLRAAKESDGGAAGSAPAAGASRPDALPPQRPAELGVTTLVDDPAATAPTLPVAAPTAGVTLP